MIWIIEGIVMCFVLLLICVIGIANGPVGLVVFYEQDVKDRVVELGLTTEEKIRKTSIITLIALFVPMLVLVPFMVYGIWVGTLVGFPIFAAILAGIMKMIAA